jgi:hypothetical protein
LRNHNCSRKQHIEHHSGIENYNAQDGISPSKQRERIDYRRRRRRRRRRGRRD